MTSCILEERPRVSGELWFGEEKNDEQGRLITLTTRSKEKVVGVKFNKENNALLWTASGNIYTLNFSTNRYCKVGRPGCVTCLSSSRIETNQIVVGLSTNRVLVINTDTGRLMSRLVVSGPVFGVEFCHKDNYLVLVRSQDHATLWYTDNRHMPVKLSVEPESKLGYVSILSCGGRVASVSREGKVAVWEVKHKSLLNHNSIGVECVAFGIVDMIIYVSTKDRRIVSVDLVNMNIRTVIETNVICHRMNVGGQTLIVNLSTTYSILVRGGGVVGKIELDPDISGAISSDTMLWARVRSEGAVDIFRLDRVISAFTETYVQTYISNNVESSQSDDIKQLNVDDGKIDEPITCAQNPSIDSGSNDLQSIQTTELTRSSLLPILLSGHQYPPQSRALIWTKLLGLPRNRKRYKRFCTMNSTTTVLQSVKAWSPDLVHIFPSLSRLLSPFLRLFTGHPTTAFEISVAILTNYFPFLEDKTTIFILSKSLLNQEYPHLCSHLMTSLGCCERDIFWPLLSTGWYLQLGDTDDWFKLWDVLVTCQPSMVVPCLVATITQLSTTLLACTSRVMVTNLLNSNITLNIGHLVTTAHNYRTNVPHENLLKAILPDYNSASINESTFRSKITSSPLSNVKTHTTITPVSSTTITSESSMGYKVAVRAALSVSPPPLPRLKTNKENIENKEASNENKVFEESLFSFPSTLIRKVPEQPMAPLQPIYPDQDHQSYPTQRRGNMEDDVMEDISSLLMKAKMLRNLFRDDK